ncbi:hypothetical protein D1872_199600 [compost metagenome]
MVYMILKRKVLLLSSNASVRYHLTVLQANKLGPLSLLVQVTGIEKEQRVTV